MSSLGPWFGGRGGGGGRRGGYDPWYGSPFSSDIWDPFSSGAIWARDQDRSRGGAADETAALAHVSVDWHETDNAHIFRADIPGVRKEELKVQVEDGNVLRISGERVREQEDTNDTWHRVERTRGTFVRRFRLPENSNPDQIKCSLDHGVLTVTVPKTEVEPTPKNVRQIDVA